MRIKSSVTVYVVLYYDTDMYFGVVHFLEIQLINHSEKNNHIEMSVLG